MKHLLIGATIAAAFAIAAPAWAQAPTAPAAPSASPATPMAPSQAHHRPMRHMEHPGHTRMGGGNAVTDQLNREELARIQGGGAVAPPPAMSGVPGQPSLQKGEPGAGMPSPSYHATPQ